MQDPRIDKYIKSAYPFAQPILIKLRLLIHKACPEVIETIKWGMPAFEYKGPMCGMASFKNHCVFNFWKASLLKDPSGVIKPNAAQGGDAMGHLGRISSIKELPTDKVIIDLIKQAVKFNDANIKPDKNTAIVELKMPEFMKLELEKNKKAGAVFKNFTSSAKNEYIKWIAEAKTEATRQKRLATAIEWVSQGKKRNWKYEKQK